MGLHRFLAILGLLLALPVTRAIAGEPLGFYIRNLQTGGYLTAQGSAHTIGSDSQPVRMAPFDATNPKRQLWYFEDVPGQPLHYFVWNAMAGRALTVHPGTKMATTLPRQAGAQSIQTWRIRGLHMIESTAFGCLDAYYANYAYGPEVGTWACHGRDNQAWILQAPK
jgi:hypothetical protein